MACVPDPCLRLRALTSARAMVAVRSGEGAPRPLPVASAQLHQLAQGLGRPRAATAHPVLRIAAVALQAERPGAQPRSQGTCAVDRPAPEVAPQVLPVPLGEAPASGSDTMISAA